MKREQVMNSILLKKRFCKDNNLPIVVYDNPYFYERLCALDILFDCVDKFEDFCLELLGYSCEQEYFEYYNNIKNTIISHIKRKDDYIKFNEENFKIDTDIFKKRNLYVEENDDKTFISIDMKKANFSALSHFSSKIFDNAKTWEEFMGQFTTSEHIINSKYIRQVILGACNPKKQIRYEKYLMFGLLQDLIKEIKTLDVFSLGEDEIILCVKNCDYSLKRLKEIISNTPIGDMVKVTMFNLEKIKGTNGWLKKIYNFQSDDEIVEFKCLDAETFHQIVKHYYKEPITSDDLVFRHNKKLAKFLKEEKNPWEE